MERGISIEKDMYINTYIITYIINYIHTYIHTYISRKRSPKGINIHTYIHNAPPPEATMRLQLGL
jgi:hypothetical protein